VRRTGREQVVDVVGEDGRSASRPVKTGVQNDQFVEITDGVQEGDQIMVQGTTTRSPSLGGGGGPGPGAGGQRVFVGGPGR
jgi:multidrug efflux pump subunit AcrA (membrane-fusion protein)